MLQPTIRREKTSWTATRYSQPSHVRRWVMWTTQSRFGAAARKARSTSSSQTLTPGTRIVVRPRLRATMPEMPAWRINRSTRLRQTCTPSARRSLAWIRGDP
jgi:hypothetical protein